MTWLAENLDYKFSGCGIGGSSSADLRTPNGWYYDNNEVTYGIDGVRKCGLLYNWYAVQILNDNRSDLIPGWHVPTDDEWLALINAVGGANVAGTRLKAINGSADGSWPTSWGGTDDFGFSALPGGEYNNGAGNYARFWTFTKTSDSNAYMRYFNTLSSAYRSTEDIRNAISVRLVKDSN